MSVDPTKPKPSSGPDLPERAMKPLIYYGAVLGFFLGALFGLIWTVAVLIGAPERAVQNEEVWIAYGAYLITGVVRSIRDVVEWAAIGLLAGILLGIVFGLPKRR